MEAKKNPDKDVNRKSGQFFLIGLSISVSVMITAFEWRTEIIPISIKPIPFEEPVLLAEIPVTKIKVPKPLENTPPKPKITSSSFTPIEASEPVSNEANESTPEYNLDSLAFTATGVSMIDEPEVDTTFYIFVEEGPKPVNGYKIFYEYLSAKIKYPTQAKRIGTEGKVFVEFIVNKKGEPTDLKIVKGIGTGCDEEAIRVIALTKWEPGKQRGVAVRVKMVLPVYFQLNN